MTWHTIAHAFNLQQNKQRKRHRRMSSTCRKINMYIYIQKRILHAPPSFSPPSFYTGPSTKLLHGAPIIGILHFYESPKTIQHIWFNFKMGLFGYGKTFGYMVGRWMPFVGLMSRLIFLQPEFGWGGLDEGRPAPCRKSEQRPKAFLKNNHTCFLQHRVLHQAFTWPYI